MDQVGKLDRILNKEHRMGEARNVEIPLLGVELYRKPVGVAHRIGRALRSLHRREPQKYRRLFALTPQKVGGGIGAHIVGDRKGTVGADAPGVHHPFGNPLPVEVLHFFLMVKVLQQRRTALPRL